MTKDQIAARERQINGAPERIASLDRVEAEGQIRELTARLRKAARGDDRPLSLKEIPAIMFTMGRFPDLFESLSQLSVHLLGDASVLPKRERQLAILRTAWLLGAPFEWGEHVVVGKKFGLSTEEIDRVTAGSSAPGWSDAERSVLAVAEELRVDAMVSDETWEALDRFLDDEQKVELLVVIGQFTNVAYLQNALRLRLEPYNQGLAAR